MPDITGRAIDRVCTIEARNRGMPHDFLLGLYEAALELTGGRPISMVAAEKLVATVGKGDVVLVLTGAGPETYFATRRERRPAGCCGPVPCTLSWRWCRAGLRSGAAPCRTCHCDEPLHRLDGEGI